MARLAQLRYGEVYKRLNPLQKALLLLKRMLPQVKLKALFSKARKGTAQFCRDCAAEVRSATGIGSRKKKKRKRR